MNIHSLLKPWNITDNIKAKCIYSKENRNLYHIVTSQNELTLKIIDPKPEFEWFEKQNSIFQQLYHSKFPGWPEYMLSQASSYWTPVNTRACLLRSWFPLGKMDRTPQNYAALANLTASLHNLKPPLFPVNPGCNQTRQHLLTLAPTLPDPNWYVELLNNIPSFENLPKSFIHGDIGPHNTLQDSTGKVLIDWDNAGYGCRIFDVAFPLIWMFIGYHCDLRSENAKAFYTAYKRRITLTAEEKDHMFSAALFFALKYMFYRNPAINILRIKTALKYRHILESWFR